MGNAKVKEKPVEKTEQTKKVFYAFLAYLKTGDQMHADRIEELTKTGVDAEYFNELLNKRTEGETPTDPGLANFVKAYKAAKKKVDPAKLFETVKDLYSLDSIGKASQKYGAEVTRTFKNMVLWRLASHAITTFNKAFNYDTLAEAKEEYSRLEKEFKLFGKPATDYEYFVKTFDKLFAERVDDKKFDPLWTAYWEIKGDEITLFGLMEAMADCKKIIEDENKGKKAAQEKYGEQFVTVLVDSLEMGLKPVPKVVEPTKIDYTFK